MGIGADLTGPSIHDRQEDDCNVRLFNVIDDFNREALGIDVDFSSPSERVFRACNHDRPNMALGGFTPEQHLATAASPFYFCGLWKLGGYRMNPFQGRHVHYAV